METTPEDQKKAARKEYKRQWTIKNREISKTKKAEYYKNNKEYILTKNKKYQLENADNIKKHREEWSAKNRDVLKKRNKIYYEKNRDKIIKKSGMYEKLKWKSDPIFRMVKNLRTRLRDALKEQGGIKSAKTFEFLGAYKEEVWKHLESKFKEGMTRENYGFRGWHIDHIKPCASFNLRDAEQQKACFHYTNLQPLWWFENLEKSDKLYYDKQ